MVRTVRMEHVTNVFNKYLFKKEDFANISNFICNNGSFEEIPLINRYNEIKFLDRYILISEYSNFLLSYALFFLNNTFIQLKKSMKEEEFNDYFACITLCDPREEFDDVGFAVPKFFISNKSKVSFLSKDKKINFHEDEFLSKFYNSLIDNNLFTLYKTISKNEYDDVIRIYIVPKYIKFD